MNQPQFPSGIQYPYQLEFGRFIMLSFLFGGGGGGALYWGMGAASWGELGALLLGVVCWMCWGLLLLSYFKKKQLVFQDSYFSCPHQSPLRMFQTLVIPYQELLNLQRIDHAGQIYLMVDYEKGQLYIGQGMLEKEGAFEEIEYLLFYQLGLVLNGRGE